MNPEDRTIIEAIDRAIRNKVVKPEEILNQLLWVYKQGFKRGKKVKNPD